LGCFQGREGKGVPSGSDSGKISKKKTVCTSRGNPIPSRESSKGLMFINKPKRGQEIGGELSFGRGGEKGGDSR